MKQNRRGTILIVTIIVSFALAATVLVLCRTMRVELMASANVSAGASASAVENGAERYVLALLRDQQNNVLDLTEDQFGPIQVGDGWFWIVRPQYDDASMPLLGLVDENSKLSINEATHDELLQLPGMTDEIAAAIEDWRDPDSNVRTGGAEDQYYLSLPEPYHCKNGRFETVEELLMVRGMTRELLYGNGSAPPMGTIASGRSSDARYSSDPQLARGLYHLLTRYGNERNRSATGAARININTTDRSDRNRLRDLLRQQFDQSTANAVLTRIGNRAIDRLFRFYKDSGLTADQFDQIADMITTNRSNTLRGRINVNTAPREVLLCLDGLTESDVDALISKRPASRASTSMSWVADALGAAKAENLGEQITVRSQQYSANIVAASGNGRAFKQVRIVVDARETVPRIIYRRDLTERGWPMDKQILASLRTGQSPETMTVASGSGGMGGVR